MEIYNFTKVIKWDPIVNDVDGNPISADQVMYRVYVKDAEDDERVECLGMVEEPEVLLASLLPSEIMQPGTTVYLGISALRFIDGDVDMESDIAWSNSNDSDILFAIAYAGKLTKPHILRP